MEEDMEEIESILDEEMPKDAKYQLRESVGWSPAWSVIDVVVRQCPYWPRSVSVDFTRCYVTAENPQFDKFWGIRSPDELEAIARLALEARKLMIQLEEDAELEPKAVAINNIYNLAKQCYLVSHGIAARSAAEIAESLAAS